MSLAASPPDGAAGPSLLLALGVLVLVAALLARLGQRIGLPTIPFFMAAGILLGPSTPGPQLVEDAGGLQLVATIGLVLLLFHLGVEFPLEQVVASGRRLLLAAGTYLLLNVSGGFAFGLLLGWGTAEALVLAGALGISSSAIVTKLVVELRRLTNAETPLLLGIIVVEDLFLAFYLALLSPVLSGSEGAGQVALDIALAFAFLLALFALARFGGKAVAALVGSDDDELLTLGFVGLALLVAGASGEIGVSDAIGALMIGLVVSRTPLRERVERLVLPLRDVFAAVFFVVFGLTIDVGALGEVVVPVLLAVLLTTVLNVTAGLLTARLYALNQRSAANIGLSVLGRGEFSLILASLGVAAGLDDRIGPFVALYVLVLAVLSPLLASRSQLLARRIPDRLLVSNWQYVRQETMSTACGHLDQVRVTSTSAPLECPQCVEIGADWVHLRLCLTCGVVACCDDSRLRHASAHYARAGHPLIASLEPGDDWRWCFVDQALVTGSAPEQRAQS
jgi:CPA2 family monovalent cation:H+ antiporter-2